MVSPFYLLMSRNLVHERFNGYSGSSDRILSHEAPSWIWLLGGSRGWDEVPQNIFMTGYDLRGLPGLL